jgi:signal transduction histidine kinase
MMGGDLYVESERWKGTTFTVRLPAAIRLDAASTSS